MKSISIARQVLVYYWQVRSRFLPFFIKLYHDDGGAGIDASSVGGQSVKLVVGQQLALELAVAGQVKDHTTHHLGASQDAGHDAHPGVGGICVIVSRPMLVLTGEDHGNNKQRGGRPVRGRVEILSDGVRKSVSLLPSAVCDESCVNKTLHSRQTQYEQGLS
eukprot:1188374-Prorocentrum_minimum.AAC.5